MLQVRHRDGLLKKTGINREEDGHPQRGFLVRHQPAQVGKKQPGAQPAQEQIGCLVKRHVGFKYRCEQLVDPKSKRALPAQVRPIAPRSITHIGIKEFGIIPGHAAKGDQNAIGSRGQRQQKQRRPPFLARNFLQEFFSVFQGSIPFPGYFTAWSEGLDFPALDQATPTAARIKSAQNR